MTELQQAAGEDAAHLADADDYDRLLHEKGFPMRIVIAGARGARNRLQHLLGDEQIAEGQHQQRDGQVWDPDADAGQVVADLAVPAELAIFHDVGPLAE
jgi:hypothetical protein